MLEQLGLTLIAPSNVLNTCSQGKGSMIDYVLVTKGHEALIHSVAADILVPWKPHKGIRVVMKGAADNISITEVFRPVSF